MQTNQSLVAALTIFAVAAGSMARADHAGAPRAVSRASQDSQLPPPMTGAGSHAHGAPVPAVTFAELEQTVQALAAARQATETYQNVRTAEAAGYRAIGPDVPGMGIHYVRQADHQRFSITEPPILLYERDAAAPSERRLVGVSYLFLAPSDTDGQPANPPFPKALASWHKHNNVCVLSDNSASVDLTESQCRDRGGQFTVETSWMVHAWIWKESPTGVFSPTNPLVK